MKARVFDGEISTTDRFPLVIGRNLIAGAAELASQIGPLSSLEEDLLRFAAGLFALDLATRRGEREAFVRDLSLQVPVVNLPRLYPHTDSLIDLLYLLSDDNWELEFLPKPGKTETDADWPETQGTTLLFSGGLDSLAAAVDELQNGHKLFLASHYSMNRTTKTSQAQLFDYLKNEFSDRVSRIAVRAGGQHHTEYPFPSDEQREPSQRTRSFLFLVLGALVARRKGTRRVLMIAENGQMAIHLPLTAARIGAFSTHTAHPDFVSAMQGFLSSILDFDIEIENPYLYKTKAECVSEIAAHHEAAIVHSVSCWRGSRQKETHCGECVPCMIRRIALEHNGIKLDEYAHDLFSTDVVNLPEESIGKRNIFELMEFVRAFGGSASSEELISEYPELISPSLDAEVAVAMYRRFAAEALDVLNQYPLLRGAIA